jgi:hypothetical protein
MLSGNDHSYYGDLLERHLDGALSAFDRDELFDHLDECEECRNILEAEERLSTRIQEVPRLVAPSDLRQRILVQALKEQRERNNTIVDDPALAHAMQSPVPQEETIAAEDGMPVFAGFIPAPRSRVRRVWRRASPIMATGFLAIAATGALYTGDFNGIPLAEQMQMAVRAGVNGLLGTAPAMTQADSGEPVPVTDLRETASTADATEASPVKPVSAAAVPAWTLAAISKWKSFEAQAGNAVGALARAAEAPVPMPAEKAEARVAVIVLKPRDAGASGGFTPSALASAVQRAAGSSLGGRLAGQDQFAYAGHRYRTFYVDANRSRLDNMVRRLEPFEAEPDASIVKAIADQNSENQHSLDQKSGNGMVFFTSAENDLAHAIEEVPGVKENPAPSSQYRVQFVVVE